MKFKSALSAAAIAGMLVITADYATMAATGGSFILGHANSANRTTALTNTGTGPVLKLSTTHPGTRPPLGVNSKIKVVNLNADQVDGKSASQLGVRTLLFEHFISGSSVSTMQFNLENVPAGTYLATMNGWIHGPLNEVLNCWLSVPTTSRSIDDYMFGNPAGIHAIDQAGVVVVPELQSLAYVCSGLTGNYTGDPNQPLQISLTRIDSLTNGTVSVS
jgi:hypothetical protein